MIKAFKFRAQAIFSLLEKTHPPGSQNLSSRNFFIILHYKYPRTLYIHQKLDTNSCFAKLRAISNLFSFFYTPCIYIYIFFSVFSTNNGWNWTVIYDHISRWCEREAKEMYVLGK